MGPFFVAERAKEMELHEILPLAGLAVMVAGGLLYIGYELIHTIGVAIDEAWDGLGEDDE